MKKLIVLILVIFTSFVKLYSQSLSDKTNTVKNVFDKLVKAYGSSKLAPQLKILPNSENQSTVARYSSTNRPTVTIDEKLIDICLDLKHDSLNALAIIISHELAHYYKDHTFCIDYAYAADKNSPLINELLKINMSVDSRLKNEAQADDVGIWHVAIAGYNPFDVFDKIIDKIYKDYKFKNTLKGYPTKNQRKEINKKSQKQVAELFPVFQAALILTKLEYHEEAAVCFDELISRFPSRENYNNAGLNRVLAALNKKPKKRINFKYPIEIDAKSRLQATTTRSLNEKKEKQINDLLKNAIENFRTAIQLDRTYTLAYINLACANDIWGRPMAAVGTFDDLPDSVQHSNSVNLIKGIAWYNERKDTIRANEYFNKLPYGVDSIINFNLTMYQFRDEIIPDNIEKYKKAWELRNEAPNKTMPDSIKNLLENNLQGYEFCYTIQNENTISICSNKSKTGLQIIINDKKILTAISQKSNDNSTELNILYETPTQEKGWKVIKL